MWGLSVKHNIFFARNDIPINRKYTLKDVELFCKNNDPGLDPAETAKYGLFITALIHEMMGEYDFITLDLENKRASHLCAELERGYVFVVGGELDDACAHMRGGTVHFLETHLYRPGAFLEGGKIIIDEDNSSRIMPTYPGFNMSGGSIVVKGSCSCPGSGMSGGVIYVSKDGGDFVGSLSKNGIIVVEGEIESVGKSCGATVYNRGARVEEVSPDGKILVRVIDNTS